MPEMPEGSIEAMTEMQWIQFLGIEAEEADAGRAVIRLDPKPVHLNHNQYRAPAQGPVVATGALDPERFEDIRTQLEDGEPIEVEVPVDVVEERSDRVATHCRFVISVRPRRRASQDDAAPTGSGPTS